MVFTEACMGNSSRTAGRLPPSRANVPFPRAQDGAGGPLAENVTLEKCHRWRQEWLAVNCCPAGSWGGIWAATHGFVLWDRCRNKAIYTQTLKALKIANTPYRQALDPAAGGAREVMEKSDGWTRVMWNAKPDV